MTRREELAWRITQLKVAIGDAGDLLERLEAQLSAAEDEMAELIDDDD
jgi:hypothetical protein